MDAISGRGPRTARATGTSGGWVRPRPTVSHSCGDTGLSRGIFITSVKFHPVSIPSTLLRLPQANSHVTGILIGTTAPEDMSSPLRTHSSTCAGNASAGSAHGMLRCVIEKPTVSEFLNGGERIASVLPTPSSPASTAERFSRPSVQRGGTVRTATASIHGRERTTRREGISCGPRRLRAHG